MVLVVWSELQLETLQPAESVRVCGDAKSRWDREMQDMGLENISVSGHVDQFSDRFSTCLALFRSFRYNLGLV